MLIRGTVVVYSIPACPHCRAAKATLTNCGLQYVDVNLERFPHLRPWLRDVTGKTSVPQIFFNNRHIGGNSELQALTDDAAQWGAAVRDLELMELRDNDPGAPRIPSPAEATDVTDVTIEPTEPPVECEQDEISRLAIELHDRSDLIMDHKTGLFTKAKQSFSGRAFVDWMVKKGTEESEAVAKGQELLERRFIQSVAGKIDDGVAFEPTTKALYRMTADEHPQALNSGDMGSVCAPRPATEIADNLRRLMLRMYADNISEDGKSVDYGAIRESAWWPQYLRVARELRRADILSLSREEKLAFFINVYNALVIHGNIELGHPTSVWKRWKFFNSTSYVLGGSLFNLQDIENGVLRGNKVGVGALNAQFSKADSRRRVALEQAEPRIHFALNCGAKSCPPVKTFTAESIDAELDLATAAYLETDEGVRLLPDKAQVHLSTLLKWYRSDFGDTDDEVLRWILPHLSGDKRQTLQQMLEAGTPRIVYIPYDWTNNAAAKKPADAEPKPCGQSIPKLGARQAK